MKFGSFPGEGCGRAGEERDGGDVKRLRTLFMKAWNIFLIGVADLCIY